MRMLQSEEVMAVAGGMIQCEPGADAGPLFDGSCVDNFLEYMYQELVSWFQWQGC